MKLLIVLIGYLAYVTCQDEFCYVDGERLCKSLDNDKECNAKYGGMKSPHATQLVPELKNYVDSHISRSFDYLLSSTYFGNYQQSRNGFEKLFRELSDSAWDDGIKLIKYLAKRGHKVSLTPKVPKDDDPATTTPGPDDKNVDSYSTIEVHELGSLSRALDTQKKFAADAFKIHTEARKHHDPEVASFLEEHFVHQQAEKIRELAGHTNDLKKLMGDASVKKLSLFLFDEYLKKL